MALLVESVMWQILFLCICSAFFKFAVAEELRHNQEVIGPLKYSPSIRAPLPYSPPSSYYPSRDFEENRVEVPLVYTQNSGQREEPQTSPDLCPQVEILESILVLLKRLLNQEDNSYVLQPDKRIQILQSLKEYLERSGSNNSEIDNHPNLKELITRTDKKVFVENDALRQNINERNHKNHIEANLILKYDIPSLSNVGCKEALATLIQTVKSAYLQIIHYCNLTGKCKLNSELNLLQQIDKGNTLQSILSLDKPISTQSQILPSNQQLLNIHDVDTSINNLMNSENQVLNHKMTNEYLDRRTQLQLGLQNNQFLTANRWNSGFDQTLNNQKRNADAYSIYLNNEARQSNIQQSNKANVLNHILSFHPSVPAQVQITPANRYPLYTPIDVQTPLSNLFLPQNKEDLSQKGNYDYLNVHVYPEAHLTSNPFLATSALNSGVVQNNNISNRKENADTSYYKYFNIFGSNNRKTNLNTFTTGMNEVDGINNPVPLIQTQNTKINNEPNQQLSYKLSQMFNDKSSSMAVINQNKHNIKEQVQYEGASIPGHEYNNFNYLLYLKPNGIKNYVSEDLASSNQEMNFRNLQNQDASRIVNPTLYSDLNIKQNPYFNSLNLNRQNSLNYNSQQADTAIQSNFGLNLYTPTNLGNYPKFNIYSNKPFDFHRLVSVPNLVKLNSISDNEGIVELTYELKRPQSISYNPYYYVKFRMPYRDFIAKIDDLIKNPHLRSDPSKFHEALLSVSNLVEASPDLKNIQHDDVSKLILNNGGTLITAKVLDTNNLDEDQYLKTVQKLNGNLNTNEILNLNENVKTYNPYTSSDTYTPIFRQENPYQDKLSNQNVNAQYVIDTEPRRLFVPVAQYYTRPQAISFPPAKFDSQIILNPENRQVMYTTLN